MYKQKNPKIIETTNKESSVEFDFKLKSGDTVEIKKDKFFRDRGKVAEIWDIKCVKCDEKILLYQKDGRGKLHRCYINRIFEPYFYAKLQEQNGLTKKNMPALKCPNCDTLIGTPMLHWEGRLAFFLIQGKWYKTISDVVGK